MTPDDKDRWIRIREQARFLLERGYVRYMTLDKLTEILDAKERAKIKEKEKQNEQK